MPTNEERREVARKLRDIEFKNHFFSPWCKAVETILDGKDCGEDDGTCNEDECCKRFLKERADLIEPEPERTCKWMQDEDGNWHTSCGDVFIVCNCESLEDNNIIYCHNCGGVIEVVEK